jgi:hypothetical protein
MPTTSARHKHRLIVLSNDFILWAIMMRFLPVFLFSFNGSRTATYKFTGRTKAKTEPIQEGTPRKLQEHVLAAFPAFLLGRGQECLGSKSDPLLRVIAVLAAEKGQGMGTQTDLQPAINNSANGWLQDVKGRVSLHFITLMVDIDQLWFYCTSPVANSLKLIGLSGSGDSGLLKIRIPNSG